MPSIISLLTYFESSAYDYSQLLSKQQRRRFWCNVGWWLSGKFIAINWCSAIFETFKLVVSLLGPKHRPQMLLLTFLFCFCSSLTQFKTEYDTDTLFPQIKADATIYKIVHQQRSFPVTMMPFSILTDKPTIVTVFVQVRALNLGSVCNLVFW